jgi:ribosomal protein S18 acetylase RimI-like enzyme
VADVSIISAADENTFAIAKALIIKYATELNVDLSFQGFEKELTCLPAHYEKILLAITANGVAVGCIGLRKLVLPGIEASSEMKRMYVLPAYRGKGIAKRLVNELIQVAQKLGYEYIYLDTLPTLVPAIQLYESVGFVRIPAYYSTPLSETVFMRLRINT